MKNDHCSIFVHSIAFVFGSLSSIVLAIECIFFSSLSSFTSDIAVCEGASNNSFTHLSVIASQHFYHKYPAAFLSLIGKGHDIDKMRMQKMLKKVLESLVNVHVSEN